MVWSLLHFLTLLDNIFMGKEIHQFLNVFGH